MANVSLDVAFHVGDMTSLRYAVPVVKTIRRVFDVDVPITFDARSTKYNSIDRHRRRFEEICAENDLTRIDTRHVRRVSKVFCVECVSQPDYDMRVSIQHGYDYLTLARNSDDRTTYVFTDADHLAAGKTMGVKGVCSPIPPSIWEWSDSVTYAERRGLTIQPGITLFYPEEGHESLFRRVYEAVRSTGQPTYVKQRRKNQSIPSDVSASYYDDVWYPSESIFLPAASTACVGFGTSAYTDLIHVRDFHDITAPSYSSSYAKPVWSDRYTRWETSKVDQFVDFICMGGLSLTTIESTPFDQSTIDSFVRETWADIVRRRSS
jgi:hypothetical protein